MSWKICVSHLFHAFSHTTTNEKEALSQLLAGTLRLLSPRHGLFGRHNLQPLAHGCRGDVFICQYRPIVHSSLRYGSRNVKMQHIVTCFQMLRKDCRISLQVLRLSGRGRTSCVHGNRLSTAPFPHGQGSDLPQRPALDADNVLGLGHRPPHRRCSTSCRLSFHATILSSLLYVSS